MSGQRTIRASVALACLVCMPPMAWAQGATFEEVTAETGIGYARTPSARHADVVALREASLVTPVTPLDVIDFPIPSRSVKSRVASPAGA